MLLVPFPAWARLKLPLFELLLVIDAVN